jgi:D-sedoheptulose 7-phosphate isomerase
VTRTADATGSAATIEIADGHLDAVGLAVAAIDRKQLARIAVRLCEAHRAGGCIYWLGNGGSAATAGHLSADLTRLTMVPGLARRLRSASLTDSAALVTACANDHGYDRVFVEQLDGLVEPADVVIGVSTSGASPSVIRAVCHARRAGAWTLGLTGRAGARLRRVAKETLVIESANVQVVEASTLVAGHTLCLMVRSLLAPSPTGA